MASGKTHDRVTLFGLIPLVILVSSYYPSKAISDSFALIISYLFAGFMFGPDLDLYSIQVKRWGPIGFIWKPYQQLIPRHRSFWSHGPIIGTLVRVAYVLTPVFAIALLSNTPITAPDTSNAIAILIGLELGAASHYLLDWIS